MSNIIHVSNPLKFENNYFSPFIDICLVIILHNTKNCMIISVPISFVLTGYDEKFNLIKTTSSQILPTSLDREVLLGWY